MKYENFCKITDGVYKITDSSAPFPDNVPAVQAGTTAEISDSSDMSFRVRVDNVTPQDFEAYKSYLASSGYTLAAQNKIGDNLFASFENKENSVHTYFCPVFSHIRVMAEKNKHYSLCEDGEQTAEPAVFASAISDRTFYTRLADNTFVIIDGGWRLQDMRDFKRDVLFSGFVKELQKICGMEKITVTAWFITHPHLDHANFLEGVHLYGYDKYFDVKRIIRNSPVCDDIPISKWTPPASLTEGAKNNYPELELNDFGYALVLEKAYKRWSNTQIIKARTGMKFTFSGMDFEIYLTPDDTTPATTINGLSLLIMQSYNGRKILWTGDMSTFEGDIALKMYGDCLRCDAVQIAHHGWGGAGSFEFYRTCNAPVQLWNNSEYGFKYADSNQGYGKTEVSTLCYDMPCCKRHVFCGGIRMEKLPLTGEMYCDFEERFKL